MEPNTVENHDGYWLAKFGPLITVAQHRKSAGGWERPRVHIRGTSFTSQDGMREHAIRILAAADFAITGDRRKQ